MKFRIILFLGLISSIALLYTYLLNDRVLVVIGAFFLAFFTLFALMVGIAFLWLKLKNKHTRVNKVKNWRSECQSYPADY